MKRHLVIPDTQVKAGVPTDHLSWIGKYICDMRPDTIIHLGDHFDMPSLSSYDRGTAKAEGARIDEDIDSGILAMIKLEEPLRALQKKQRNNKEKIYKPRKVFLIGNHEERIARHVNANPELVDFLSYDDLCLTDLGWEVHDYLKPVDIDGILYSHYFANPLSGRALTGTAANMLKTIGRSFVQGHRQVLDFTTRTLCDGTTQLGIVAGACYQHQEGYKGYQGNHHFRGIMILNEVENGYGDPMFVSLNYLKRKYGQDQ